MKQYVMDERGRKTAVLIPIKEYEKLLEDLDDLRAVAARRDNPKLSEDEVKRRLRADGLLKSRV
ncbi:MAG TPA: hypothetical protein VNN10_09825 [Dehalococcoidia bacterium]|jgi:hypothetical protein|nr:hypothetical protein [Dehalococcoidia bacterium]